MINDLDTLEQAVATSAEIAADIKRIADASERLLTSHLTRRALIVLISDASNQPPVYVERVLDALPKLRKFYLAPTPAAVHEATVEVKL